MENKGIIESNEELRKKMEKKLKKEQIADTIKLESPKKMKRKGDENNDTNPAEKVESEKMEGCEEELGKITATDQIINVIIGIEDKQKHFGKTNPQYTVPNKSNPKKPSVDVLETKDSITVKVDLPGVEREEISLGISKGSLDVMATFPQEIKDENPNYIQKERIYGKVSRSIVLPAKVKTKKISAELKNCILTVKLPKLEKDVKKININ